jgi:hypothetical protein
MRAYHNDPSIKADILAQLAAHRAADQLVRGQYWENGKGCAVGCTIHSGDHLEYETRFGIPVVLARIEDRIFEGLPTASAMEWPERLMRAIPVGANLAMAWPKFALWLLTEELAPRVEKHTKCAVAVEGVAMLYREWCESGVKPDEGRWRTASGDAAHAADAAFAAYAYASASAHAADAAFAAYAYASASAHAASAHAASAAHAYAAYAAYAASVASAASAASAASSVASADAFAADAYMRMADKLIEILSASGKENQDVNCETGISYPDLAHGTGDAFDVVSLPTRGRDARAIPDRQLWLGRSDQLT